MKKLIKAKFVYYDDEDKTYNKIPGKGFPQLLVHICDDQLQQLSKEANYQHYLSTCNLPPPIQNFLQPLNNIKVRDIKDKIYYKEAFSHVIGTHNQTTPIVYGNNKNTLFAAAKRQMKSAPTPSPEVIDDFISFAKQTIDKELGPYLKDFSYSFSQWYNHLPAKKQKLVLPIHNYFHHPEKLPLMTSKQLEDMLSECYQAICKSELQLPDGKPRMVCSIPQKVKYVMGPVTWSLEELCSKHFNGYCGNKNLTQIADQLNEFAKRGFTKVVEGDGSAFDNTQDITLKEIDRYLYSLIQDKVYHVPKDLFIRIANTYYKQMKVKYRDTNGKLKTFINYFVLGTVFSGDCDTTLCNTMRMALYNRYINHKFGLKYDVDYVVMSKGDDFSVLYKPYISDELIKKIYYSYFLPPSKGPDSITDNRSFGIGQICKFLTIGDFSTFKFCSLRSWFINDEGDIYLTRDPTKLYDLAQYSIKYKKYNIEQKIQYNLDLAMSYLINYSGIHIFNIIAAAHINEAYRIANNYTNNHVFTKILKRTLASTYNDKAVSILTSTQSNGLIKQGESRDHLQDDLFEIDNIFYNTEGRENFYKIDDEYWETMKRMMMVNTRQLTEQELQMVNNQIDEEFSLPTLLSDFNLTYDDVLLTIKEFKKYIGLMTQKKNN